MILQSAWESKLNIVINYWLDIIFLMVFEIPLRYLHFYDHNWLQFWNSLYLLLFDDEKHCGNNQQCNSRYSCEYTRQDIHKCCMFVALSWSSGIYNHYVFTLIPLIKWRLIWPTSWAENFVNNTALKIFFNRVP